MADEKKSGQSWIVGLVIAGVVSALIGVALMGSQQSARNQQNLIDNLPAVQAQLKILASEMETVKQSTLSRGEVEAKLEAFSERLNALEGQISRRFNEVVNQPLDLVRIDVEKNEDQISKLREDIAYLKSSIEKMKND